jgi:hypothetical protein
MDKKDCQTKGTFVICKILDSEYLCVNCIFKCHHHFSSTNKKNCQTHFSRAIDLKKKSVSEVSFFFSFIFHQFQIHFACFAGLKETSTPQMHNCNNSAKMGIVLYHTRNNKTIIFLCNYVILTIQVNHVEDQYK